MGVTKKPEKESKRPTTPATKSKRPTTPATKSKRPTTQPGQSKGPTTPASKSKRPTKQPEAIKNVKNQPKNQMKGKTKSSSVKKVEDYLSEFQIKEVAKLKKQLQDVTKGAVEDVMLFFKPDSKKSKVTKSKLPKKQNFYRKINL